MDMSNGILSTLIWLPIFLLSGFRVAPIPFVGETLDTLLPPFVTQGLNVQFYFGGTSLLIVVVVVMDFIAQIQAHLMSHQYESLLKKANFKGTGFPVR